MAQGFRVFRGISTKYSAWCLEDRCVAIPERWMAYAGRWKNRVPVVDSSGSKHQCQYRNDFVLPHFTVVLSSLTMHCHLVLNSLPFCYSFCPILIDIRMQSLRFCCLSPNLSHFCPYETVKLPVNRRSLLLAPTLTPKAPDGTTHCCEDTFQ